MQRQASPGATLLVTTLSSFLTSFGGSAVTVALPSIGRELHGDAVILNWIVTIFLLTSAMFLIPTGRFADIIGRKRVFTSGIVLYTLSSLGAALATSTTRLVIWRGLQGIGGAMIFGTSVALLVSVYPLRERGRVIGINTAAVYLGLSVGPVLGGILTHTWGWQSIFWILVLSGPPLLALVAWKFHGEWRVAHGEPFDVAGSAIYAASLAALLLGLSRVPAIGGIALTALGLAGIAGFFALEERVAHPVFNVPLFRNNRAFAFSNLAAMINYAATFAVAFFISLYLQHVKGMNAQAAGIAMVIQPVLQAVLSPLAGWLSDRIEPRLLASSGMAVTTLGLSLLVFLAPASSIAHVEMALALLGTGFALFSSPNTNAIMSAVDSRDVGAANATLATMRVVGQMLSMALALLLLALLVGRVELGPDSLDRFQHALRACFAVFAVLCLAGIFASLARGKLLANASAGQPSAPPEGEARGT